MSNRNLKGSGLNKQEFIFPTQNENSRGRQFRTDMAVPGYHLRYGPHFHVHKLATVAPAIT
jgi:hypothetical protein